MNRKERMDAFMNNEKVDRVPLGFWHHFVSFHNHYNGDVKEIYDTIVNGQKKFIDDVEPDFVKIMSDGFFGHPSVCKKLIQNIDDLREIESVGASHTWIDKQVEYVKEVCEHAGDDVYKFYSVFSPLQYIRLRFEEYDEDFQKFVALFKEDKDVMLAAAHNIANDIKALIHRLFTETKIDGIYYSVQCVQDKSFDEALHNELVKPLDLLVLQYINEYTDKVILHVCGYGNYTNELSWYKDYPAKVVNWAVHTENISLAKGKEILGGKAVLGGFDNNGGTVLYDGGKEDLKQAVHAILDEAGVIGIGLGADCTIAEDIDKSRLQFIKEVASEYSK